MKIAVLGTGMVGQAIASKLISLGHSVMMGSRTSDNSSATHWTKTIGKGALHGSFAEAGAFGELFFNCTNGQGSIEALNLTGKENLAGKVLIDVANPLDSSKGMPPSLSICNTDSLGELIQRSFPEAKVVKSLNTMNCNLMVEPSLVPGDHSVFVSGNDAEAKETVKGILKEFGWKDHCIIDLGDISTARGAEQILPIWLRLWGVMKTPMFNFNIVKG